MKNLILIIVAIILFSGKSIAQSNEKSAEIIIKTSAECGMCKKKIEEKLNYTKGIRYAELNVKTKELTIGYTPNKITSNQIKTIISEIGYDADDVPANPKAQKLLPACCQPGGMD